MSATELLTLVAFVEFGGIIALGVVLIVSRSQLKEYEPNSSPAAQQQPSAAGGAPGLLV